ncbi:hypothetical protein MAR_032484, partial [Mya arenaria]
HEPLINLTHVIVPNSLLNDHFFKDQRGRFPGSNTTAWRWETRSESEFSPVSKGNGSSLGHTEVAGGIHI